jgi:hypothetical protein
MFEPFSLLDDIQKVLQTDKYSTLIALKLRDMRKFDGRDHLVIELKDRELLLDFMSEAAEEAEDEVIIETNQEFSILVNSSPVWFSFDDINRCKKEAKRLIASGSNVLTGYLELKQTGAINAFKSLFQGSQS